MQRILILGTPFSSHFPNVAPPDKPAVSVYDFIRSMNTCIALSPHTIVFQHGLPVYGSVESKQMLYAQRDALAYIRDETLRRMNALEDMGTIAATLELPEELATSLWNQQVTTTVADVVRAVYTQSMGENHYTPAALALQGLSPVEQAARLVDDLGDTDHVINRAEKALRENTLKAARWASHLAHAVLLVEPDNTDAAAIYQAALKQIAFASPSAYHRNLLLEEAASYDAE